MLVRAAHILASNLNHFMDKGMQCDFRNEMLLLRCRQTFCSPQNRTLYRKHFAYGGAPKIAFESMEINLIQWKIAQSKTIIRKVCSGETSKWFYDSYVGYMFCCKDDNGDECRGDGIQVELTGIAFARRKCMENDDDCGHEREYHSKLFESKVYSFVDFYPVLWLRVDDNEDTKFFFLRWIWGTLNHPNRRLRSASAFPLCFKRWIGNDFVSK